MQKRAVLYLAALSLTHSGVESELQLTALRWLAFSVTQGIAGSLMNVCRTDGLPK